MAEKEKESGFIESILDNGEAQERAAESLNSRADDVAAAIMMDTARFDPALSHEAKEYLRDQRALVRLQVHHFEEERVLGIEALKRKRYFDHMRMSFQIFMALVATAIAFSAFIMVWDAVHSRSVVIDEFDVSSNAVGQVPNGRIVSAGLLDVLTRIQVATRTSAERRSLSNAWTNDIAIEVPETGISIGQIENILKTRFGHDQHISGDVVINYEGGLALTVRGPGILAKTFTDGKRNIDKLLNEAGEYVYGQSQPGLWANYLASNDRDDDAIRFAEQTYPTLPANEKPYVLNDWAIAIVDKGDPGASEKGLTLYRETLRLKPDYWTGYNNVMTTLTAMGDEEGTVKTGEQMMKVAGGRPGRALEIEYQNYDQQVWDLTAWIASNVADMESHGGIGTNASSTGAINLNIAQYETWRHDVESATVRIKTTVVNTKSAPDISSAALSKALLAEEFGDLKTAAAEWDNYATAYKNPTVSILNPMYMCFAAPTYEKTGQPAKADAALDAPKKATGYSTFVDCYRFRADVLELRGDWAGAQAWYANAIKLGPSIPSGYYSFGMALLKHDDLNRALEQFKLANQKGPHWADPLKGWGDVLVKQGHRAEALDRYDEALKYAPNWGQLKQARAAAEKANS